MTHSPAEVVELLERFDLRPQRSKGQNFVADPNTVRRIARLAGVGDGDQVLEIGPGVGSLTLALLETGAQVSAVEVDKAMLPIIEEVAPAARVVLADAMCADWEEILEGRSHVLVANLPYNIATPLIADLLDDVPLIERMLVMVQLEVGERLAAAPGSKAYGIPSIKVAYWATASVVGKVPPSVFIPRPRVDSALVEIVRRPDGPATEADREVLFRLVRTAFGQRRKMIRKSLGSLLGAANFEEAGVRPESRPEDLSVEQWGWLANSLSSASGSTLSDGGD
ncbi:MAG: 16S rRNA (adenine(1518)-N(6)/adenine(1519)-N(6))-dimethyltransferase RsmA [Acidimicrobiales bacterium]